MNKLEVVILGAGIWGNDESFPPSALVIMQNQHLLFDCGEGVRFRIRDAGYNVTDIQDIAITEIHPDHCALSQFYQAMHCKGIQMPDRRKPTLNLYVPYQIKRNWPKIWDLVLPELKQKPEYLFPRLNWNVMKDESIVQGKDFILRSFKAWHGFGKVETLIYRLEHHKKIITYVGDTGPCEGLLNAAKDADLLICEASSPIGEQNHKYGHLNPIEAGEYAREANVKHLVVTHYFGINSPSEILKDIRKSRFKGKVTIAKDLMKIKI